MSGDPLLQEKVNMCTALPGAKEMFPFGDDTHVIKLSGKMFALIHRRATGELYVSLKCEPAKAEILMQEYHSIIPGYHLNKEHWITIVYKNKVDLEPELEEKLMENSYRLVFRKLTKKKQQAFRLQYGGEILDKET